MIAIASGREYCVALRNDGTVWTWGRNFEGQLGIGTWGGGTHRNSPAQVVDPSDPTGYLTAVEAIAAGEKYTLAIKSNGTLWAWGENNRGQLGDGTTTAKNIPVQVTGLTGVVATAGGNGFSLGCKRGWHSLGVGRQLGRPAR